MNKQSLCHLLLPLCLFTSIVQAAQECLGRLSFDQPKAFEWALATSLLPMDSHAGFVKYC